MLKARDEHGGIVNDVWLVPPSQAGSKRTCSFLLFCHTMATRMLENGADLQDLQAILGHADLNTTTIYTHLSIERLRRVHESTHPAEK